MRRVLREEMEGREALLSGGRGSCECERSGADLDGEESVVEVEADGRPLFRVWRVSISEEHE